MKIVNIANQSYNIKKIKISKFAEKIRKKIERRK